MKSIMPKFEVQELPTLDTRFLYPMPLPQKIVDGQKIGDIARKIQIIRKSL